MQKTQLLDRANAKTDQSAQGIAIFLENVMQTDQSAQSDAIFRNGTLARSSILT